jgi:hypothetical protein
MKAEDIIKQLMAYVPIFTDKFTDNLSISEITSSGLVANVETSTAHGLATGDFVNISGTLVPNPIISLTSSNGIATAETQFDNDLTEGKFAGVGDRDFNVNIIEADQSEYNGEHLLLTSPNRRNFTYQISGSPTTPATGTPKLIENLKYGYNGWHEITVVDANNFTFDLQKAIGSPAYGNPVVRANPNISGAVTLERGLAAYTKQDTKYWAFVVLGNRTANKDRQTYTDATATFGNAASFRQLVIQPFSVYVVIPTTNELAARSARDSCEDLIKFFSSSLLEKLFNSVFTEQPFSKVIFSADNFVDYTKAYYVHEFVFEATEHITYPDTIDKGLGVAFRDIDVDYLSSFSNNSFMTDNINLDDEPL